MTEKTLCLTCVYAKWRRTISGRLHRNKDGHCFWTVPDIQLPAAFGDNTCVSFGSAWIGQDSPITSCPTYKAGVWCAAADEEARV